MTRLRCRLSFGMVCDCFPPPVLVFAADPSLRAFLGDFLSDEGFRVTECATVAGLLARLGETGASLIVLDYFEPSGTGDVTMTRSYVDLIARVAPTIVLMDPPSPLTFQGQRVPVVATLPLAFTPEAFRTALEDATLSRTPSRAQPSADCVGQGGGHRPPVLSLL